MSTTLKSSVTGTTNPMMPKGILRKEGVTYPSKSLHFPKEIIAPEPEFLSVPRRLCAGKSISDNPEEQENFQQVWREVSSKKLNFAAKTLQKFARKFMLCWIITNDRRTDLYEELDSIQERLLGDLERLEWEKEDLQQEADLELQAEREDPNPGEYNKVKEDLTTMKGLQAEIRAIKADNQKLKVDNKSMKKQNKQLGYDLKEKAPAVEMNKCKVSNLEQNHLKIRTNHDQYLPNIQKWQDSLDQMNSQWKECQRQGTNYRDACLKALEMVQTRSKKKRLVDKVMDILNQDFAKHYPVPPRLDRSSTEGQYDNNLKTKSKKKIRKTKTDSEVEMTGKKRKDNNTSLLKVVEEAILEVTPAKGDETETEAADAVQVATDAEETSKKAAAVEPEPSVDAVEAVEVEATDEKKDGERKHKHHKHKKHHHKHHKKHHSKHHHDKKETEEDEPTEKVTDTQAEEPVMDKVEEPVMDKPEEPVAVEEAEKLVAKAAQAVVVEQKA